MKGNAEWEGVLTDIGKEKAPCLKIRGFRSDTASTYQAEDKKKKKKKSKRKKKIYLKKTFSF